MDLRGLIEGLFTLLYIAVIGRVILSWIQVPPSNPLYPIATIIYQVTEPILGPIRRVLPNFGMLDLSPMVAIFLIIFVQRVIINAIG